MDENKDTTNKTFEYGPWPWIVGLIFGLVVVFMLFGLSDSIS